MFKVKWYTSYYLIKSPNFPYYFSLNPTVYMEILCKIYYLYLCQRNLFYTFFHKLELLLALINTVSSHLVSQLFSFLRRNLDMGTYFLQSTPYISMKFVLIWICKGLLDFLAKCFLAVCVACLWKTNSFTFCYYVFPTESILPFYIYIYLHSFIWRGKNINSWKLLMNTSPAPW